MRRNQKSSALLCLVALSLGMIFIVAFSRKPSPQNVSCPSCPGGVCPAPYRALEAHYTSVAEPRVDVPPEWREPNYAGGSCVHATTETMLRHLGMFELAAWWRDTYSGGEGPGGLSAKMKAAGLKFVQTTDADVQMLKWAIATRRGAGIGWPTRHCTYLVDICDGNAVIEDNNHTTRYSVVPWDRFEREWRGCGGWAFVLVYDPPPPTPRTANLNLGNHSFDLLGMLEPRRKLKCEIFSNP